MPQINTRFEIASCVVNDGDTPEEVAKDYGIDVATVCKYTYLLRAGRLPKFYVERPEPKRTAIERLLAEGFSIAEIMAQTGFKRGTIATYAWEAKQGPKIVSKFALLSDAERHNVTSQSDADCHVAAQDIDSDPLVQ